MTASVVAGVALVVAFVGDPDTAAGGGSNFHFIALLGCLTALKGVFLLVRAGIYLAQWRSREFCS